MSDETPKDSEDNTFRMDNENHKESYRSQNVSKDTESAKHNVIMSMSLDRDVLELSIKAMDKLVNYFNPTNSLHDQRSNPMNQFKKSHSPLSIQIIPNVNKIRVEKARAVSAIRERKCSLQELIEECKQQKNNEDMYQDEELEPISYYRENIFNLEDYYLYRAVMKFYYEDYEGAIKDYKACNRLKSSSKHGNNRQKDNNMSSHMSSQTDLSDIGLCSFNTYETSYNILLCYLCAEDIDNALTYANKLIDSVPSKYKSKLYLIRGLLYQEKEEFDK